jgi:hypothetical protein
LRDTKNNNIEHTNEDFEETGLTSVSTEMNG